MLNIVFEEGFLKTIEKIKDASVKEKTKKQIKKIIENTDIGKPMRYDRQGTRELYVSPYRISYAYLKEENKLIFLEIYHKDEQ